jgi:hypothetical protein
MGQPMNMPTNPSDCLAGPTAENWSGRQEQDTGHNLVAPKCQTMPLDQDADVGALGLGLVVIPVLPDGRPDLLGRVTGIAVALGQRGMILECTQPAWMPPTAVVVGVQLPTNETRFAGLKTYPVPGSKPGQLLVGGVFGGPGHELLQPENLVPRLRLEPLRFECRFPVEMLRSWVQAGVLRSVLADRVLVCPACQGLPTFRPGCHHCGCARLDYDRLIHHYACAYVGFVHEFEAKDGTLTCPKCRCHHLVVGADFEHLTGPYRCPDCCWSDSQPERVAQCLRCGLRFPSYQAHLLDLEGFHVDRLDPLAFPETPQSAFGHPVGTAVGR